MLKSIFFFSISFLLIISRAEASAADLQLNLIATQQFGGDRHGDFRGDYLAILSDGSQWKIHPKDKDLYSAWNVDDACSIKVRTSFYWFKREHKFELFNHTRQKAARVMLIAYPEEPLRIISAHEYLADVRLVPRREVDEDGNEFTNGHDVIEEYEKVLLLSDGSSWIIDGALGHFQKDYLVYLGFNKTAFFLIKGNEREAVWTWARKRSNK